MQWRGGRQSDPRAAVIPAPSKEVDEAAVLQPSVAKHSTDVAANQRTHPNLYA